MLIFENFCIQTNPRLPSDDSLSASSADDLKQGEDPSRYPAIKDLLGTNTATREATRLSSCASDHENCSGEKIGKNMQSREWTLCAVLILKN